MTCVCEDIVNCKECRRKEQRRKAAKKYRENNREKVRASNKKYQENNKEKRRETCKKYIDKNKDKIAKYAREYRDKNIEALKIKGRQRYRNNKESINKRQRERWLLDTKYKLRKSISLHVRLGLCGVSKNGSVLKKLPYTMEELKSNLESKFEKWMNWDNWGVYNASDWDDNDSSTWTWQIDHITPQSRFNYKSMDDEEFKKCWALDNLRPYSAKLNVLEGSRR